MAKIKRKSGTVPKYAQSMTELGGYLCPPRDRKIIQMALKLEGNPGRSKDGRYHIAEWDAFIRANYNSAVDPTSGDHDKRGLEKQRLQLQVEKLKFELEVSRKDYSSNVDIEIWVGSLIMQAKTLLLSIPSKLAPQVVGLQEVEAEKLMRSEINAALAELTSRPLGA